MNEDNKTDILSKVGKNNNLTKIIIAAGMIGIALIFLSNFFSSDRQNKTVINVNSSDFDTDSYRIELESRLADIISHISGAGKTGVMITLEGGREYIYAQNNTFDEEKNADDTQNSRKNEYFTIKSNSNESPVLIRESEPKVRGVIVVCSGADDPVTREKIIEAVTSVFNIT